MTKRRTYLTLGFLSLAAFIGAALVNGGPIATNSPVNIAVSACGFFLFLASWIMAVYAWSQRPSGVLHIVALIFLVPLGFLWGWVYLIAIAATERPVHGHSGG